MPSIRSKLAWAGGLLSVLLIAGSVMVCQHCGATIAADSPPMAAAPTPAPPAPVSKPAGAKTRASKKSVNGPSWQALTPAQQLALAPLAGEWNSMDGQRKEKWIAIGNKYARMSAAEQSRIQTRMRDWIKLTPAQRRSVRQSYASTKKWDADQKSAQWQQYLQLSDEQKAQLAKQKLSPAPPVTAVSRVKPKPPSLLPKAPGPASGPGQDPARTGATLPAPSTTVAATAPAAATPATSLATPIGTAPTASTAAANAPPAGPAPAPNQTVNK